MHSLIVLMQCARCALNGRRYYSRNPLLRCQVHGGLYQAVFFSFFMFTCCESFRRYRTWV